MSPRAADNVFLGEVGHVPELGAHLWPRLAAAYIEARLAPALPEDDTDLTAFDRVRWRHVCHTQPGPYGSMHCLWSAWGLVLPA